MCAFWRFFAFGAFAIVCLSNEKDREKNISLSFVAPAYFVIEVRECL